jgi:hypothetical protein
MSDREALVWFGHEATASRPGSGATAGHAGDRTPVGVRARSWPRAAAKEP